MQQYVEALKLVKALESRGLVSVEMPPSNFLMSDRLVGFQRNAAEQAMDLYAQILGLGHRIIGSLKLFCFAALAVCLADVVLR